MDVLFHSFPLSRHIKHRLAGGIAIISALTGLAMPGQAQVNVLTHHNDIARTGQNLAETNLTTSNVNVARFGKLFERPVDSNIWAQPLYVSNISIPNKGNRNVVYVETEVGQVYAFDADNANETDPFWRRDLAPNDFSDSVSTPVINLARNTIYLTVRHVNQQNTANPDDDVYWFTFHGLDLTTGADKFPAVTIQGSVPGTGKGSVNGRMIFRPSAQKQRPALLDLNGEIYAAFGTSIDAYLPDSIWNGWIFSFNSANGAIKRIFATTPDRNGGGIWQAGNGLASDGTDIFAMTANGGNNPVSTSTPEGGRDYGNSALRLTPDTNGTTLTVKDFWTPWDFQYMEDADQDLGSSGPILVPGTNLIVHGDKSGGFYVLDKGNMGKFTRGRNNIVQDFQGWKGHLHGSPVYWNSPNYGPLLYGWSEHNYMLAYKVLGNQGVQTTPVMRSKIQVPPGMPGSMLAISARGSTAGTGIVWANGPLAGDANLGIVPGILRAFDATDLSKELWNSEIYASRDKVGNFAKFAPPTIANGKVYLGSFYNQSTFQGAKLIVYGLLPAASVPPAPTNLTAASAMSRVRLSWRNTTGATSYTLKRGTKSGGPYTIVATNLRDLTYDDTSIVNGTKYFYVVNANNSGGTSGNSNEASATPFAPANGSVISIDFIGGGPNGTPQPMGATEKAGLIVAANWNSLSGGSGNSTNLRALGGAQTSAAVNWDCAGTYSSTVPDTAGNYRMMKGYLSNSDTGGATVTVTGLPSSITKSGYDVYVYVDGNNPTASRGANYTISGNTQHLLDAQNRDFDGPFLAKNNVDVGNYLLFENVTGSSFKLTAASAESTDSTRRCPINGIQIVANQNTPPQVPAGPTNLVGRAGNNQVALTWTGVAGATSYNIMRSQIQAGPYNTIKTGVTVPEYGDATAKNGRTYFYYVTAISPSGESGPSNTISAAPTSNNVGRIISMDFGGGSTPAVNMSAVIGAPGVERARWNSTLFASGGLGDLVDDLGAKTTADVTWDAQQIGDTSITANSEAKKMMRGYITPLSNPATVNVYNLSEAFTKKGYDVYVFFDNNNAGTRTGRYTIGSQTVTGTDTANTNFNGTFVQANNGNGNFVKLMGFNTPDFTLTATPVSTSDGVKGAPINGIQIVARNGAARGFSVSPKRRVSIANIESRMFTAEYRDIDGNGDILRARILINSQPNGTNGLIAHYDAVTNKLYLVDNQGDLKGGFAPGSNNIIETGRGILHCKDTKVTRNGTALIVEWVITPKTPLIGTKNVYTRAIDTVEAGQPWKQFSTWVIQAGSSGKAAATSTQPSAKDF